MPSVTGTLVDDTLDLDALAAIALGDLPFESYYIAGVALAVPPPFVSKVSPFLVVGTSWPAVPGTAWRAVRGSQWTTVDGSPWRPVRRP